MSTLKVNEVRNITNTGTANIALSATGDVTVGDNLSAQTITSASGVTVSNGGVTCATITCNEPTNAPFTITSTAQVNNLNVQKLQGKEPGTADGTIPLLGAPVSANTAPGAGKLSTEFLNKAVPAGAIVGLSDTQQLSNKSHSGAFTISDGALTVNGTGAAINCTGDITAFSTSDIRLKKNIRSLTEQPLKEINKLEGVRFEWLKEHDPAESTSVGVIAQQVREVLPEAVTERENGTLAVRYELIIPLLIEAIKQLDKEVLRLKQDIHGEP